MSRGTVNVFLRGGSRLALWWSGRRTRSSAADTATPKTKTSKKSTKKTTKKAKRSRERRKTLAMSSIPSLLVAVIGAWVGVQLQRASDLADLNREQAAEAAAIQEDLRREPLRVVFSEWTRSSATHDEAVEAAGLSTDAVPFDGHGVPRPELRITLQSGRNLTDVVFVTAAVRPISIWDAPVRSAPGYCPPPLSNTGSGGAGVSETHAIRYSVSLEPEVGTLPHHKLEDSTTYGANGLLAESVTIAPNGLLDLTFTVEVHRGIVAFGIELLIVDDGEASRTYVLDSDGSPFVVAGGHHPSIQYEEPPAESGCSDGNWVYDDPEPRWRTSYPTADKFGWRPPTPEAP